MAAPAAARGAPGVGERAGIVLRARLAAAARRGADTGRSARRGRSGLARGLVAGWVRGARGSCGTPLRRLGGSERTLGFVLLCVLGGFGRGGPALGGLLSQPAGLGLAARDLGRQLLLRRAGGKEA